MASRAWALHQIGTRAACQDDLRGARSALTRALELREVDVDLDGAALTKRNLQALDAPASPAPGPVIEPMPGPPMGKVAAKRWRSLALRPVAVAMTAVIAIVAFTLGRWVLGMLQPSPSWHPAPTRIAASSLAMSSRPTAPRSLLPQPTRRASTTAVVTAKAAPAALCDDPRDPTPAPPALSPSEGATVIRCSYAPAASHRAALPSQPEHHRWWSPQHVVRARQGRDAASCEPPREVRSQPPELPRHPADDDHHLHAFGDQCRRPRHHPIAYRQSHRPSRALERIAGKPSGARRRREPDA